MMNKTSVVIAMQLGGLLKNEKKEVHVRLLEKLTTNQFVPEAVSKLSDNKFMFESKNKQLEVTI